MMKRYVVYIYARYYMIDILCILQYIIIQNVV
jgi:hypothetical protein